MLEKTFYFPDDLWHELKATYLGLGPNNKYYRKAINTPLIQKLKSHFYKNWLDRHLDLLDAVPDTSGEAGGTNEPSAYEKAMHAFFKHGYEHAHMIDMRCLNWCGGHFTPRMTAAHQRFVLRLEIECYKYALAAQTKLARLKQQKQPQYQQPIMDVLRESIRFCFGMRNIALATRTAKN